MKIKPYFTKNRFELVLNLQLCTKKLLSNFENQYMKEVIGSGSWLRINDSICFNKKYKDFKIIQMNIFKGE